VAFAAEGQCLPCEPRRDRRQRQQIDEIRIELCAAAFHEHVERMTDAGATVIPAAVRDGIERVGDRDDARGERNAPPA
jgi:hypothetical protein